MIADGAMVWTSLRNHLGMGKLDGKDSHRAYNFEGMDINKNSYATTFCMSEVEGLWCLV